MAKYNMESHYTHEVDEKYKSGWDDIFGKKEDVKEDTPPEVAIRARVSGISLPIRQGQVSGRGNS